MDGAERKHFRFFLAFVKFVFLNLCDFIYNKIYFSLRQNCKMTPKRIQRNWVQSWLFKQRITQFRVDNRIELAAHAAYA